MVDLKEILDIIKAVLKILDRKQRCYRPGVGSPSDKKIALEPFIYEEIKWESWGPEYFPDNFYELTDEDINTISVCPICPTNECYTDLSYRCGILWSKFTCPSCHFKKRLVFKHYEDVKNAALKIAKGNLRRMLNQLNSSRRLILHNLL